MGRRRINSNYYYDDTYENIGKAIGNIIGQKWSGNEAMYERAKSKGFDSVADYKASLNNGVVEPTNMDMTDYVDANVIENGTNQALNNFNDGTESSNVGSPAIDSSNDTSIAAFRDKLMNNTRKVGSSLWDSNDKDELRKKFLNGTNNYLNSGAYSNPFSVLR